MSDSGPIARDLDGASRVLDHIAFRVVKAATAIDRLRKLRWFYVRGRCVGCGERKGWHGAYVEDPAVACPVEVLLDFERDVMREGEWHD